MIQIALVGLSILLQAVSAAYLDSGCTTLAETTTAVQQKDGYQHNFGASSDSSSVAEGYHYRVTAQVTTPSSYGTGGSSYEDVFLFGAAVGCGGWFGGLRSGQLFIGTQCNQGSDAAIADSVVLPTSTAFELEWNYNPKSGAYHVVKDGALVMSGSASFVAKNGYISLGYGSHTNAYPEPWMGGLASVKVEWCRVCGSACSAGYSETTACTYTTNRVCTDIDACASTPCAADARCEDSAPPALGDAGGRTCTCNDGFFGDGTTSCTACAAECVEPQFEQTACTSLTNRVCGCDLGWGGENCDECDVSYSGEDCQCSRYQGSHCRTGG